MLRIHTVTSATGAKKYYATADYYTEGAEVEARVGGKLAEWLGLSGTIDRVAFERLCDNLHPLTGEPLTPRTNEERRVGYDFVFSGPKSFSILEALASEVDRKALLAAFDSAVKETMVEAVEPDMQTRNRLDGADEDRTTGNMLWTEHDHTTSRQVGRHPPDMHKHRHVLAFNATWDAVEQRIKAGQFGNLKRDGEYYAAVFYSKLALKLEALGYRIDRRGGKEWEIAGIPQSMIDKFSKRTAEVEDEHEERLKNDPDYRLEYKHELGAKTRSKKQNELTPAELRRAWVHQLTDDERDALMAVYRREAEGSPAVTARESVAWAIRHLGEQRSVWPERELMQVALLHGLGHVTLGQVEAELPRQGVIVREKFDRRLATTAALQREEERIVGFAAEGRGSVVPVGIPVGLSPTLTNGKKLSDEQWGIVTGLLRSSNRVNLVQGPAGAGKSWSLQKYDEAMRLAGEGVWPAPHFLVQ